MFGTSTHSNSTAGDLAKVNEKWRLARGSMTSILQLTEIPPLQTSQDETDRSEQMRKVPMVDECVICWALQDGEDETTRVPLPTWVSNPVERKILEWTSEQAKWNAKIDLRAASGLELPPASKAKYEEFCKTRSTCSLLFSKKQERSVQRVRNLGDWKKLKPDLVSLELQLAENPENLRVKIGTGPFKRLVLLKGQPTEVDMLPAVLADGGVAEGLAERFIDRGEEDSESGEDAEIDGREQEGREMEHMEGQMDREEVLVLSGDEEDLEGFELETHKFIRVKNFCRREVYRRFDAQGLASVPPGCMISYHNPSCTWQGYYKKSSCGLTLTHSSRTKRSEGECLWGVLLGLAERHCSDNPRDRLWAAQLAKLRDFGLTVAKM